MNAIEKEPVIKKARMDLVENVPMVSQNDSVADVDKGNEQVGLLDMEEDKETCVALPQGSLNDQVPVELESNEQKIEQILALSLADGKQNDPKQGRDLEMEEKEVGVLEAGNIETKPVLDLDKQNEIPVTENNSSYVASGAIDEENRSDPISGKKLLVLDLNGLLADIVNITTDCKADINIGRRAIFKRPYCEDFLKFCFDKFEVGIWSSRKQTNVERITEFLLGDMRSKLLFCWDMSHCATTTVGSLENRYKYVVFKDLNQLWGKRDSKLPWEKGYYNETNTVLLDDSPYKALLNPPYTAIFPHSYNHHNKADTSLGNGGDLRVYLEKLVEAKNVQDFIKTNPFGQEAITESSESWEFYKQAIHMHTFAYSK